MKAASPKRARIDSVDLLRGLVMVIMLLDHTRDFVHSEALRFDPTDLTRTWPILFYTRWITHFCAPIFVFLAGTGAYFQIARGKTKAELSRFLITRGLWLIFLELTVIRLNIFWDFDLQFLGMMQVIWTFGWCMIVLAGLIHLPLRITAVFGLLMIAFHNLTDVVTVAAWRDPGSPVPNALEKLWTILHQGGFFPIGGWPSPVIFILYPLIPWIGVMAAGYEFGRVYDWPADERRKKLMQWGAAITLGFVILRLTNVYGNPGDWAVQKSASMTVVSFLNLQKYPPSLLYLMMTLGPALIALSLWERFNAPAGDTRLNWFTRAFVTFGRVPLFFYLLQWPTAHLAGYLLSIAAGKPTGVYFGFQEPNASLPPDVGFSLGVVYAVWIAGTLLLYPLCRWYADFKARRADWWLSYL